jgi:hypothetical protein
MTTQVDGVEEELWIRARDTIDLDHGPCMARWRCSADVQWRSSSSVTVGVKPHGLRGRWARSALPLSPRASPRPLYRVRTG